MLPGRSSSIQGRQQEHYQQARLDVMLRSGVPNSVGTATQLGVLKKDLDLAQLLFDPVAGSACVRA